MNRRLLSVLGRISSNLYCSLRKPECQFLDGLFLLPSLNQQPYNIIRCNQDRFLYYLSVYVKSFKELFLNLLVSGWFLKSECKSTNYFSNKQEIPQKSLEINSYLTVQRRFRRIYTSFSLYYTREAHAARVRPHRCTLEKKKGIRKGKPNVEVSMGRCKVNLKTTTRRWRN